MEASTADHAPDSAPKRTAEDVNASATAAGLSGSSVGPVQLLHFSPHLHSEEIRLMEVQGPILAALRNGDKLVIRGSPNDDAVLCTSDKTFEIRVADTSNTLLIAPSLNMFSGQTQGAGDEEQTALRSCEVTACLNSYLELRPCRPRTEKLRTLVSECPYRGAEFEAELTEEGAESQGMWEGEGTLSMEVEEGGTRARRSKKKQPKKYSFEDLLNLVQASEAELRDGLRSLQACLIEGYWRCLDPDYRDRVFQHVLTLLEEKDWSYKHVPLRETCQILSELEPEFAIEHCISCYGDVLEDEGEDENEVYYRLSEVGVCQFYAELLLRPAGKFILQEFLTSWQQSVPEGMKTFPDYIKGLALTDVTSVPPSISYFPAAELPQDPAPRFLKLFQVRAKWTLDEIEPYVRDLETPTQSLNALLMKHARVSTDSARGVKVYSSRRI